MSSELDLLNHIYQTAEMGQDGIQSVLKHTEDAMLISTLNRQRDEYRQLQNAAEEMLRARGMQPQGISPAARLSSGAMTALKTLTDHSPANIAEMMIQGSTMGVTKSMRTMGTCSEADPAVLELAQRLLRTEQANIEQMKGFLS